MSIAKLAIKFAVKIPKIETFETYLFVGPHPDDIEIGAGATVAKLVKQNKKVVFLICTDGRFGDGASKGITGDALAQLRKEESIESAKRLGVTEVRFLNLKDGAGYTMEELEAGIAKIISEVKPDMVFAPDPLSKSECHPDHLNVGNAVKHVSCFAPYKSLMLDKFACEGAPVKAIALYMTATPNCFVKVRGLIKDQLDAIFECHRSQYQENEAEAASLKLYLKIRYYQYFCREGFLVYSQTHMHCLPEA